MVLLAALCAYVLVGPPEPGDAAWAARRAEVREAMKDVSPPRIVLDNPGVEPRQAVTWKNQVGDSKVYRAEFASRRVRGPLDELVDRLGGDEPAPIREECEFTAQVTAIEPDGTLVVATSILNSTQDTAADGVRKRAGQFAFGRRGETGILRIPPPGKSRNEAVNEGALAGKQGLPSGLQSCMIPLESLGRGAQWHIDYTFPPLTFMELDGSWTWVLQEVTESALQVSGSFVLRSEHSVAQEGSPTRMHTVMVASATTRYVPGDALPEWAVMDSTLSISTSE